MFELIVEVDGLKICCCCRQQKAPSEFRIRGKKDARNRRSFLRGECNDCRRQLKRGRNPLEASRPRPEFCECCGRSASLSAHKVLAFDHDHETGKFRGWLCNLCNLALGGSRDNPMILVNYLIEHGGYSPPLMRVSGFPPGLLSSLG